MRAAYAAALATVVPEVVPLFHGAVEVYSSEVVAVEGSACFAEASEAHLEGMADHLAGHRSCVSLQCAVELSRPSGKLLLGVNLAVDPYWRPFGCIGLDACLAPFDLDRSLEPVIRGFACLASVSRAHLDLAWAC